MSASHRHPTEQDVLLARLRAAIDELGPTEETAVAKLRELGVRSCTGGLRSGNCVLSRFFSMRAGQPIHVGGALHSDFRGTVGRFILNIPQHLAILWVHFDANKYPDLIG